MADLTQEKRQPSLAGWSHPFGCFFFGEHYTAEVFKGKVEIRRRGGMGVWTEKHLGRIGRNPMLFLLPLFDVVGFMWVRLVRLFSAVMSSEIVERGRYVVEPAASWVERLAVLLGDFLVSIIPPKILWLADAWILAFLVVVMGLFMVLPLFWLWFWIRSPVKRWHGAEHKAIIAASHDDLENAREYNPLTPRCGSNLVVLLIPISLGLGYLGWTHVFFSSWMLAAYAYMRFPLAMGSVYRVSKYFQGWFFLREPDEDMMQLCIKAVGRLVEKEKNFKANKTCG